MEFMMKYQGGKHRTGAKIVEHIMEHTPEDNSGVFYDLFCGSCAVIKHIPDQYTKIANDIDRDLIWLFQWVQNDIIPHYTKEEITKDQYYKIKSLKECHPMKAYVGIFGSYAGKKWGGYARGENRDYFQEATSGLIELRPHIQDVIFMSEQYNKIPIVNNSIVYCDPPYQGTTGYKYGIDYDEFYDYLQILRNEKGCHVFLSEYTAPDNFIEIWSNEQKTTLAKDTDNSHKRIDKLWRLSS